MTYTKAKIASYYNNDQHQYENDVDLLIDMIVDNPKGITLNDWPFAHTRFNTAVHNIRRLFAQTKDVNLVCEPAGFRERWVYRFVGNVKDAEWWVQNRISDQESRLLTLLGVCSSIATATHANSKDGRKARKMVRGIGRLIEDLDEIEEEFAR